MAEAKAVLRYARMSPRKVRMVIDVIRGRGVSEALTVLKYMPRAAAPVVEKVLHSAVANAGQRDLGDPESLKISRAYVDGGPILKRFQARAMGRAFPIHKRTSHVTIVVSPSEDHSAGSE